MERSHSEDANRTLTAARLYASSAAESELIYSPLAWRDTNQSHSKRTNHIDTAPVSVRIRPHEAALLVGLGPQSKARFAGNIPDGQAYCSSKIQASPSFEFRCSYDFPNFYAGDSFYSAIMNRTFASSSPSPPVFPYIMTPNSWFSSTQQLSACLGAVLLIAVTLYWSLPSHSNLKHVPLLKSSNGFSLMNLASKVLN